MLKLFFAFFTCLLPCLFTTPLQAETYSFDQLLAAIRQVETGGYPNNGENAIGDGGKAIGPFQIWRVYHIDAHEFAVGRSGRGRIFQDVAQGKYSDCNGLDYSESVVALYFMRYHKQFRERIGDKNTLKDTKEIRISIFECEDLARLHNSGPGWRNKKEKTDHYWSKVKRILQKP
jgi:hypothetical protein